MLIAVGCSKSLTKEDVVGSYKARRSANGKKVFLENGTAVWYVQDEKLWESKWKIVGKEVHVGDEQSSQVYKIEPNGDLTGMAWIKDGKRLETPKEKQHIFKILK